MFKATAVAVIFGDGGSKSVKVTRVAITAYAALDLATHAVMGELALEGGPSKTAKGNIIVTIAVDPVLGDEEWKYLKSRQSLTSRLHDDPVMSPQA